MIDLELRLAELERILKNPAPIKSAEAVSLKEYFSTKLEGTERAINAELSALKIEVGDLKNEVRSLRTFKDQMEGKASTTSVMVTTVLALAGLILSILGLL